MLNPKAEYRENPNRCVYLTGEIGQATLDRLTPHIVQLRLQSSEPITLYIDSPGGSTYHASALYSLLKAPSQDGKVCPLITVVTSTAASAAADLLASGDYAIAYPHAQILFHGTRTGNLGQPVTREVAVFLSQSLEEKNEQFALDLANRAFGRFVFRYAFGRQAEFEKIKGELNRPDLTDVECMSLFLESHAELHAKLMRAALEKQKRLNAITEFLGNKLEQRRRKKDFGRQAEFEAFVLKCIIDFDLSEQRRDESWTFTDVGLLQLERDFLVMRDFYGGHHRRSLSKHLRRWAQVFLTDEEKKPSKLSKRSDRTSGWKKSLEIAPVCSGISSCRSVDLFRKGKTFLQRRMLTGWVLWMK